MRMLGGSVCCIQGAAAGWMSSGMSGSEMRDRDGQVGVGLDRAWSSLHAGERERGSSPDFVLLV